VKLMVDLDGTLFPTYSELNTIHKALFNKEIDWGALPDGNHKYWKTKQGQWLMGMFENDLFYAELLAYKGAKETLRIFLRDSHNKVIYCTARSPCLEEATAYSLGRNNLPYGDIIFVEREKVDVNKALVVKTEGIDIAIDDEAKVMLELKDECTCILYLQPYNVNCPYGFRAEDWWDIHRLLLAIGGD
jgi:uncharacterized HAD superfamily protein